MPFPYTFPATFENHYDLAIDWDNSGSYGDATGEIVTGNWLAEHDLVFQRGRDQIRALAPPMVGQGEFELYNASRDYSPENSSGPLYGNLRPGIPIRVRYPYSTAWYPLWQGVLEEIQLHPEWNQRSVTIRTLGNLAALSANGDQKISTALYQSITTDVALGYLLDAVGWPAAKRTLDTGQTTLDWWWLDNEDALSAAVTLMNSEGPGAALYEDASGNIVFESRHYRLTNARCTSVQTTFSATAANGVIMAAPFAYNPRWKDVINLCTVTHQTRAAAGSLSVVWSLGSTVTLAGNQVGTYVAKASDPFNGAVTPVAVTDYTVTAGSLASVSLNRTSGTSVTITLTAGASGATLTGLQLRAYSVPVTYTTNLTNTIDTAASKAIYGTRPYPLAVRQEIAVNTLQDFCNAVVGWYQVPRPAIDATMTAPHSAVALTELNVLNMVLVREISDRVTVVEPQSGMNVDCFIERVEHRIQAGGQLHSTHYGLEKTTGTNYFVLDTSTLDGVDVLGW